MNQPPGNLSQVITDAMSVPGPNIQPTQVGVLPVAGSQVIPANPQLMAFSNMTRDLGFDGLSRILSEFAYMNGSKDLSGSIGAAAPRIGEALPDVAIDMYLGRLGGAGPKIGGRAAL